MPTIIEKALPARIQAISKAASVGEGWTGCGWSPSSFAAKIISKTPRMVGRTVKGVQITPTSVAKTEAEAINPQKILTIPLSSVMTAMAVTRFGLVLLAWVLMVYSLNSFWWI